MVSEWRSVIAVSLNVGGGVRLIKPAKLYMCTQNTTNTTGTDARHRCVRQWFRTPEPLGKRRYENWNTHTRTPIMIIRIHISINRLWSLILIRSDRVNLFSCRNTVCVIIFTAFHFSQYHIFSSKKHSFFPSKTIA